MRIALNISIAVSILFFPWWVAAVLMVASCFIVSRFYEVVLYGIAIDALYASSFGFHGFPFFWSAFAALVLVTASFLRSRLSW